MLDRLALSCVEVFPKSGELVAREGDSGTSMDWIVGGEFQVFIVQDGLGLERELRELRKGDHFGEVSLLTGSPRTASVKALSDGHLLRIEKDVFLDCLKNEPGLLTVFLERLGRYLLDATRDQARVPLVRLDSFPRWKEHRHTLPGRIPETCRAVVVSKESGEVWIGMENPYDDSARNFLVQVVQPLHPRFIALTKEDLARALNEPERVPVPDAGLMNDERPVSVGGARSTVEELKKDGVDADLRWIFQMAQNCAATDVHLDPVEGELVVRLRVQGNMVTMERRIMAELAPKVPQRLKILAGMDTLEHRRPQDGSFILRIAGQRRNVRVSVIPSYWGEKVALRLLPDEDDEMLVLETLVPNRLVAAEIRELFSQPSGLVLVCGPAGSGKTTLLYAGLRTILEHSPVSNIVAIEDPVDRLMRGVTQVPVNRRVQFGFAEALRATLRQDPDVMLVGEIRDRETAMVAVEAAATGHLVVSSVHAHFAANALTRLRSLDADPFLIESSLRGVVALRLVPRNCPVCVKPMAADDPDLMELKKIVPPMAKSLLDSGVVRGAGCEVCHGRGTSGRMALVEVLRPDKDVLRRLLSGGHLEAAETGWMSMAAYAAFLASKGLVAPEWMTPVLGGGRS